MTYIIDSLITRLQVLIGLMMLLIVVFAAWCLAGGKGR
jgi:hypothetical protein